MVSRTNYGGECTIFNGTTGEALGRFWIELDFRRGRRELTVAVLNVSAVTGARLHSSGELFLHLDDGRQLRGIVSTVLRKETIIALTLED